MKATKLITAIVLIVALVAAIVFAVAFSGEGTNQGESQSGARIILSEIMASNKGIVLDPQGQSSDYVELYNTTAEQISLGGYLLSCQSVDNPTVKNWTFPDNTVIEPYGYLIIWCTGDNSSDSPYTNFKLSVGEVITFGDAAGNPIANLEIPTDSHSGVSYCYDLNTNTWVNMLPSPGYPNTAQGIADFQDSKAVSSDPLTTVHNGVYISEFMASNSNYLLCPDGEYSDWVELYNTTDTAQDLSGFGLSDDPTKPFKYTFPEGTVIQPYSYLLVYSTLVPVDGYLCLDFGLSASGEELLLTNADGGVLDHITFSAQQKNYSYARNFEGGVGDFYDCDIPSPGYPNDYSGYLDYFNSQNPDLGVHDITINEVLVEGYYMALDYSSRYNSQRPFDFTLGNWVEFYNNSDFAVDLSGFSVSDDTGEPQKWVFPDGTSIAAKGYLILVLKDGDAPDGGTYMTLNFDIRGTGETLYLYNNEGTMIDLAEVPACHATVSYGRDASGNWVEFETPTPNAQNGGTAKSGYAEKPVIELESGLYSGEQTVTIAIPDGCYVTYTLDATTPDESSSRYSGPIIVGENTVVRARAFAIDDSTYGSDTASATYIILGATDTQEAHSTDMNVIFLVTDPETLWDPTIGIYVLGNDYQGSGEPTDITSEYATSTQGANFNQSGRCWEREATFTYLSAGGTAVEYEADLMIRIFGAYSRAQRQKSFALITRKGYGVTSLDYAFFDNRPFTSYNSLVMRQSGKDAQASHIRDILIAKLCDDGNLDMASQAYVQCETYLNGEYWGIYNLREKVSTSYIAQHYSVEDKESIDLLVGNGTLVSGSEQAEEDYAAMIQYCEDRNCVLSDSDYAYLSTLMDMENYALYCSIEIVVGNKDTGNIKFWRSSEKDSKWRWLIYDFCDAMNGNGDASDEVTSGYRRDFFRFYFHEEGHGAGKGFSTVLSRSLLSNNQFVDVFLTQLAKVYEAYSTENIVSSVDELSAIMVEEMEFARPRWNATVANWQANLNNLRQYGINYPSRSQAYCYRYINERTNYDLSWEELQQRFSLTDEELQAVKDTYAIIG
ncbi:MAG: lamin tail domain-containing protein [Clostridia bacterium]|nr:lamin tail domain-containing protein [Clostridia bacterium]